MERASAEADTERPAVAAAEAPSSLRGRSSIGYLGPTGTFTEQALLTQPDLAELEQVALPTIPEVLQRTVSGDVDLGFAPVENAIEGTVNVTQDMLAFEVDLSIQREVVIPVELNLLVVPGTRLEDVRTVISYPHASAQSRQFLSRVLPGVTVQATNSTADAARLLAAGGDEHETFDRASTAAIATSRAAEIYGLETIETAIEDHLGNSTRFVVLAREGIPRPTGHDKTSIVVFQRADAPGSLLAILQEFAARAINLTKLESRPTRKGLGDYCFLIDLEGHIADEVVADCLTTVRARQADVKLLGSYPAAGDHAPAKRAAAGVAWEEATAWMADLRRSIG